MPITDDHRKALGMRGLLQPILPNQISAPDRNQRLPFGEIQTPEREMKDVTPPDMPFFKDKNKMAMMLSVLSNGFGNMTLRGNGGLKQMNNAIYAQAAQKDKENKTMQYLAGHNPDMYRILQKLPPDQRGDYIKLAMESKFGLNNKFRTNTSGVQVDEETGRQFVVESDGYGNPPKIRFLKDEGGNYLRGETAQSEADLQVRINGINQAADKGGKFFDQAESLRADIRLMAEAKQALADGAQTGIARQYLPAFDEATQRLRTAANKAGINVINSATFGALSEKEMALALSTGIPQGLNEQELDQYLTDRIAAQEKLYAEINQRAMDLNSGTRTLGEWQKIWKEQEEGIEYDDGYASRWSNLSYDKSGKKDDDDDDDIIDVTNPAPTLAPQQAGPRRRRY